MKKIFSFLTVSLVFMSLNAVSAVPRTVYDSTLTKAQNLYQNEFNQKGLKLLIENKWDDDSQNAYTVRLGNRNIISVLGGLARNPYISIDSLALVACSELGISLGGFPQSGDTTPTQYSVRGQADYFGTAKCLKKFFADEDNKAIVASKNVPAYVDHLCTISFPVDNEKYICIRSALAGDELARALNSFNGQEGRIQISLSTPSRKIVDVTIKGFPEIQCRLDSYLAGAICNPNNSTGSIVDGYCHNNEAGSRPLCWFKPSADE